MIRRRIDRMLRRVERPYDVYNRIEVSRAALLGNLEFFRTQTGLQIIPVLKGNAYGHGIEQVASALKGQKLQYIAVDGYFEALKIRSVSRQNILVMGMIKPGNFPKLRLRGLTFVVQDKATIEALGKLQKRIKIHLELNTGMNRYGVTPDELDGYLKLIGHYPKLGLEGVMTHLADADGTDERTIDDAVKLFDTSVKCIMAAGFRPSLFHVGQSAGSLRVRSRYANSARVGLGLYGVNPFSATHPLYDRCKELRPALTLMSTISKVQKLKPGDKVSYNYTFTAHKDMRIGILPLGYHEGVDRQLSNAGVVRIGKGFRPIVGRVCMNHTMVDISGADIDVGDEVVVYSNKARDANSIVSIAREHKLFPYTLLTDLSPDVRRYLID